MLWYLLPDGRGEKYLCEGWVGSSAMPADLTTRCRFLRSMLVQFPNQAVMQLLGMLSIVPL